MNILFGEKLRWPLAIMALPQVFIFVVLQLLRNGSDLVPWAYQGFFLFQAIFLIAVGVAVFFDNNAIRRFSPLMSPTLGLVGGTGVVFLFLGVNGENAVLLVAGTMLSACAQGTLYLQCFLLYTRLSVRARIAFIMLGFALTPPIRLILVFFPEVIRCIVAFAMPITSAWLYRRELRNQESFEDENVASDDNVEEATLDGRRKEAATNSALQETHASENASWKTTWRAETRRFMPYVLIIALFSFGLGYFHAPFDSGVIGVAAYESAYLKAFVLLGIFELIHAFERRIAIDHLCQIALLVSVVALAIAVQFDTNQTHGLLAITADLAWYVIVCLLFVMLADLADKVHIPPLLLFVLGWTPYLLMKVAGNACANLLLPFTVAIPESGFFLLIGLCALGGGILVYINIQRDDDSLLFGAADGFPNVLPGDQIPGAEAPEPRETDLVTTSNETQPVSVSASRAVSPEQLLSQATLLQTAFETVSHQYALTERERDVMELIYEGYSKKAIADKLIISQNTVRTHTRTLYAKLDIHSRDQLLDLVKSA